MPSKKTILLDIVRGASALAVAFGHLRNLMLVDYVAVSPRPGLFVKVLYFISGFGHQAVLIFFVLSGYLIAGSVFSSLKRDTWDYRTYAVSRLCRLLGVLIPALIVGFLLDKAGMAIFGTHGIYSGSSLWGNALPKPVETHTSLGIFLGNAFFLQGVFVPTAGSNGVLWTLSSEFSYYFVFMFAVMLFQPKRGLVRNGIVGALAFGFCYVYWGQIRSGFHIWLFGALVAFFENRIKEQKILRYFLTVVGFSGVGIVLWSRYVDVPGSDTLVGFAVAVILVAALQHLNSKKENFQWKLIAQPSKWFAEQSYTLYATHLPLVVLLCALYAPSGRLQPTPMNLIRFTGSCILILGWSRLMYWVAESRAKEIREFTLNVLGLNREIAGGSTETMKRAA